MALRAMAVPGLALAGCAPQPGAVPDSALPSASVAENPHRVPPPDVAALIGAAPDSVETTLGRPVLRRPDGKAEVWLYATESGCRLDIVLYPERAGLRVAHASTRTPNGMTETNCLRAIADRPA
jgi:hypothetical protein